MTSNQLKSKDKKVSHNMNQNFNLRFVKLPHHRNKHVRPYFLPYFLHGLIMHTKTIMPCRRTVRAHFPLHIVNIGAKWLDYLWTFLLPSPLLNVWERAMRRACSNNLVKALRLLLHDLWPSLSVTSEWLQSWVIKERPLGGRNNSSV
jgi:hypothetical protein